jgi:hypothetical protein
MLWAKLREQEGIEEANQISISINDIFHRKPKGIEIYIISNQKHLTVYD